MEKSPKRAVPKNPNKRPCVAKNITFPNQKETDHWIRKLSKKPVFANDKAD